MLRLHSKGQNRCIAAIGRTIRSFDEFHFRSASRNIHGSGDSAVQVETRSVGGCDVKIHGLCIVKNETDILEESLASALRWCDHIYIFDNGSTDGTWELVKNLAIEHPQIVPYKQD